MRVWVAGWAALLVGCTSGGESLEAGAAGGDQGFEPPVLTNAESPVRYPPTLFRDRIEGTVVLRLFIDETGTLVPDSTRVAEASGQPALDSAALDAVSGMRFAPARRDGRPVATPFLQPVHFQHPARSGSGP
jgi:TonB family protein